MGEEGVEGFWTVRVWICVLLPWLISARYLSFAFLLVKKQPAPVQRALNAPFPLIFMGVQRLWAAACAREVLSSRISGGTFLPNRFLSRSLRCHRLPLLSRQLSLFTARCYLPICQVPLSRDLPTMPCTRSHQTSAVCYMFCSRIQLEAIGGGLQRLALRWLRA